jgi:uncharacterized protein (DUF2461 family)
MARHLRDDREHLDPHQCHSTMALISATQVQQPAHQFQPGMGCGRSKVTDAWDAPSSGVVALIRRDSEDIPGSSQCLCERPLKGTSRIGRRCQARTAIGLADARNVVLAREFRTDVIAALDHRHFRVVHPLTPHSAFRLLPADVP